MRIARVAMTATGALILAMPGSAEVLPVAVCVWNNLEGGPWSVVENWSPGQCPDTTGEAAVIPNDGSIYGVQLDLNVDLAWFANQNPQARLYLGGFEMDFLDELTSVNMGRIVADIATTSVITGNFANDPTGLIEVLGGAQLTLFGNEAAADGPMITNNGWIVVNAAEAEVGATLWAGNDLTFAGGGHLLLGWGGQFNTQFAQVTNADYHTITGSGSVHAAMVNDGSIVADGESVLGLYPVPIVPDEPGVTFVNYGYIHALDYAELDIDQSSSLFEQYGKVYIAPHAVMQVYAGDYTQVDGTTTVNGLLRVPDAGTSFDMQAGSLYGRGTVEADVNMADGGILPGGSFATGSLLIAGDLAQADGALAIDLGDDTDYDTLEVTGTANVGGSLYIMPLGLYVPAVGTEFVIVTAGQLGPGRFDTVISSGAVYDIVYDQLDGTITVSVVESPLIPDINGDGVVGINDLLLVLANWGACGDCGCPADVNGDCRVGILDLLAVLFNWTE